MSGLRGFRALAAGLLATAVAATVAGVVPALATAVPLPSVAVATTLARSGWTTIALYANRSPVDTIAVYGPRGTSAHTGAAPGAVVGRIAEADVQIDATDIQYVGPVVALARSAPTCVAGPHAAVWQARLHSTTGTGGDLTVPIAVDLVDLPYATLRITLCAIGTDVRGLWLWLDHVVVHPAGAGQRLWRALFTPDTGSPAGGGVPVEARSLLPLPVMLDLVVMPRPHRIVRFTGRLMAGGRGLGGQTLIIRGGRTAAGITGPNLVVGTRADGRFTASRPAGADRFFLASTALAQEDLTSSACGAPITAGGCASATRGPVVARSRIVPLPAP